MELKIGGNKNEEKLKKQIKDFNIQEIVTFEGWVSGNKKLELLNWADVFILPSFNEGLPISILEAMSYGMPIISTPVEASLKSSRITSMAQSSLLAMQKKFLLL